MNEVIIRAARAEDLAALTDLLRAAALPEAGVSDFFPANYAVAVSGAEMVGAIGVEQYGRYGLLRSAVVHAAQRGNGLGNRLTQDRLRWSRQQGLQELYLLTTTAPGFFARLGFVEVARSAAPLEIQESPEFKSICPSTAVTMRLAL